MKSFQAEFCLDLTDQIDVAPGAVGKKRIVEKIIREGSVKLDFLKGGDALLEVDVPIAEREM